MVIVVAVAVVCYGVAVGTVEFVAELSAAAGSRTAGGFVIEIDHSGLDGGRWESAG